MIKYELAKGILPLALVASLGAGACSGSKNEATPTAQAPSSCPFPNDLTAIRLIGGNKESSTNAVNGGDCVAIWDKAITKIIGQWDHDTSAYVLCRDQDPASFEVMNGQTRGTVKVAKSLTPSFNSNEFAEVPDC